MEYVIWYLFIGFAWQTISMSINIAMDLKQTSWGVVLNIVFWPIWMMLVLLCVLFISITYPYIKFQQYKIKTLKERLSKKCGTQTRLF